MLNTYHGAIVRSGLTGLRAKARQFLRDWMGYPVLRNVNGVADADDAKRALLIYMVQPFQTAESSAAFLYHHNFRQSKQMASLLGDCGYVVDVADVNDRQFIPDHSYDVVLSQTTSLQGREKYLKWEAKKIYLSTGAEHRYRDARLRKRDELFQARRHTELPDLQWCRQDASFLDCADAIVGFGNDFIMSTWHEATGLPVHGFNNYGLAFSHSMESQSPDRAKHFLFFGSSQQLLKGLDLLLDIFPRHPDLHLYVCGHYARDRAFCHCYRKELFETENIHPMGYIYIMGDTFRELVLRCGYVILPSCTEGQPGGVVQCMHAGLVPVLTRDCGIDTLDFGILFDGDDLAATEKAIVGCAGRNQDEMNDMSANVLRAAQNEYSEEAFLARWRVILSEVGVGE